jgi:hypothetical protein
MDLMLDLETLGTKPDTVILTLGAVKFNPYTTDMPGPGYYVRPDVDEQLASGRSYDEDTLTWWNDQDPVVREEALGTEGRISIEQMMADLNRFLVGVDNIFCQGPVFDISILENIYQQYSKPVPWHYWQIRDSRTIFKMINYDHKKNNTGLHNALADSYSQAIGIQEVYCMLKITKDGLM